MTNIVIRNFFLTAIFILPSLLFAFLTAAAQPAPDAEDTNFERKAEAAFAAWEERHANRMQAMDAVDFRPALSNITLSAEMTPQQEEKLRTAVAGFFQCYAAGAFEAFRKARLETPFDVDTNVVSNLLFSLPKNHQLPSDKLKQVEELWNHYVGANRILKMDPSSIKVSVELLTDRRQGIFARAAEYVPGAAVGYLPRVVVVHPTAKEVFERQGKVLHATTEAFVVTSANPDSVDPLFVSFYWVDEAENWFPYEVARITGDFRILY